MCVEELYISLTRVFIANFLCKVLCSNLLLPLCSQIIINKEPTKAPSGLSDWVHYNMKNSPVPEKEVWDVKRLLEVGK